MGGHSGARRPQPGLARRASHFPPSCSFVTFVDKLFADDEHTRHAAPLNASLRPVLDISYCHHEKWDGSSYPRGLKAAAIPLSARIFAVVDVWDGLRSDRPYRPGWPPAQVRAYIREQAGQHFDPAVTDVFLSLDLPG